MNKKTDLPEIQEFLGRYLDAAEKIRSEKDYVASLRSIVENTTTHLSFTAGRNPSKTTDKLENTMIDIVEEERKLSVRLHELALIQALAGILTPAQALIPLRAPAPMQAPVPPRSA